MGIICWKSIGSIPHGLAKLDGVLNAGGKSAPSYNLSVSPLDQWSVHNPGKQKNKVGRCQCIHVHNVPPYIYCYALVHIVSIWVHGDSHACQGAETWPLMLNARTCLNDTNTSTGHNLYNLKQSKLWWILINWAPPLIHKLGSNQDSFPSHGNNSIIWAEDQNYILMLCACWLKKKLKKWTFQKALNPTRNRLKDRLVLLPHQMRKHALEGNHNPLHFRCLWD